MDIICEGGVSESVKVGAFMDFARIIARQIQDDLEAGKLTVVNNRVLICDTIGENLRGEITRESEF